MSTILTVTDPLVLDAVAKLNAMGDDVANIAIERDDAIVALKLGLVAEQNIFMGGLPGVAKSLVFTQLFARIDGAKVGFFTLTKGSTPEALVGPMSIKALEQNDVIRYNTTNMLPDVEYAYITEVFKGNALTRNAALQVLNERVFLNGGQVELAKLRMCASDSNEFPDSREDLAFWDRFLIRMQIDPVQDFSSRMRMVRDSVARGRGFPAPKPMITKDEIRLLTEASRQVEFTPEVDEAALHLINALHGEEISIGDRRFCDTFAVAGANALLRGRMTMTIDDLAVFVHTAWSNPDDRRKVQQAVLQTISPETASITRMYDEVEEAFSVFLQKKREADKDNNFKAMMAANSEFGDAAESQWREIRTQINKLQKNGRDATSAIAMMHKVKGRVEEASKLAIRRPGLDDDDLSIAS